MTETAAPLWTRGEGIRDSLAKIGKKYGLDPNNLAEAIVSAYMQKRSGCGKLTIQCRMIDQELASFLVTNRDAVVSQFRVRLKTLRRCASL